MGKHTDAVKSLDEFRAPWETEGGTDAEIDKPKLRRFIHNLITDKARAQDARDEVQEKLATAEKDLEAAQAEAADANGEEAQKKIDKLQSKVDSLTKERDQLVHDKEVADVREEVLGDFEREHPKAAKYVTGETREELEKSLEEIKEDFGITDEDPEDDEDDDDIRVPARVRPVSRLKNGTDKDSGKGAQVVDFDAVAADILPSGPFG